MKIKTIFYICLIAILYIGCDNEDAVLPSEPAKVIFTVEGNDFEQTRASYPIGQDGTGPKFGVFHVLQTTVGLEPEILSWGNYEVQNSVSGKLSVVGGKSLYWKDSKTEYIFRAISVPADFIDENGTTIPSGVKFHESDDYSEELGEVTFGDYKTGLEYFVGVAVAPVKMPSDQSLAVMFQRQVSKVAVWSVTHEKADGTINKNVDECTIIFPNLPTTATFTMTEFHAQSKYYEEGNVLKKGDDYVTLRPGKEKGVKMNWKKVASGDRDILQACYLPPFKIWDGPDNSPENQSGFFVVEYDGKNYTGNIYGNDEHTAIWQGRFIRLNLTLKDGPVAGGGEGSAIAGWNTEEEDSIPHHRYAGIYSQEEADQLLDELKTGNPDNIPSIFFQEEYLPDEEGKPVKVKVIRLLTNIDWSSVTDEVRIPDGFALMGCGFNVLLGDNGSIKGSLKGKLYINGLLYVDGVRQ